MSTLGITPGPWQDKRSMVSGDMDIVAGNKFVATIGHVEEQSDEIRAQIERDARAIAEVPAMIEALEELLKCADGVAERSGWPDNGPRDKARALLARINVKA